MKFTIKQMLVAMIAFALVASILGASAQGSPVAFGLTIGLIGGLIILAVLALVHWIAFTVASMLSDQTPPSANATRAAKEPGEFPT